MLAPGRFSYPVQVKRRHSPPLITVQRVNYMKIVFAILLSISALTCTLAQAEDGSERLRELHQMHQQSN
ncbi:hypothetical protein GCM10007418_08280 [Halopseudomonas salina]|uniref:Uncharacterized protein n=1 Tax=Halopseudomonas salina TaxID=1323744 RepID=A0ABQ1P4E7_9GAMM|nr:hypothetical protein GCM10007418_08280 [Halopseudomonas salina]